MSPNLFPFRFPVNNTSVKRTNLYLTDIFNQVPLSRHHPSSQTPEILKISSHKFVVFTESETRLDKRCLICVNIVEYTRRKEIGNARGTPLYGLYGDVPLNTVWFVTSSSLPQTVFIISCESVLNRVYISCESVYRVLPARLICQMNCVCTASTQKQ